MQHYPCYICRKDSLDGGSLVHEGMFFKLCKECLEDEEAVRLINEGLLSAHEEEQENRQYPIGALISLNLETGKTTITLPE